MSDKSQDSPFGKDNQMLRKGIDELFATVQDYASSKKFRELLNFTTHFKKYIKFMVEKGADPNAVSWIALDEIPCTPLDSIADDINAYGSVPNLQESFSIIDEAGGKYFSELVPSYYEDDE